MLVTDHQIRFEPDTSGTGWMTGRKILHATITVRQRKDCKETVLCRSGARWGSVMDTLHAYGECQEALDEYESRLLDDCWWTLYHKILSRASFFSLYDGQWWIRMLLPHYGRALVLKTFEHVLCSCSLYVMWHDDEIACPVIELASHPLLSIPSEPLVVSRYFKRPEKKRSLHIPVHPFDKNKKACNLTYEEQQTVFSHFFSGVDGLCPVCHSTPISAYPRKNYHCAHVWSRCKGGNNVSLWNRVPTCMNCNLSTGKKNLITYAFQCNRHHIERVRSILTRLRQAYEIEEGPVPGDNKDEIFTRSIFGRCLPDDGGVDEKILDLLFASP
jgi:hypothetical protein